MSSFYKRDILNARISSLMLMMVYMMCVMIWDYTIMYQAALVILVFFTICVYQKNTLLFTPYTSSFLLVFLYFLFHTLLGFSVSRSISVDILVSMFINLLALFMCVRVIKDLASLHTMLKVFIYTSAFLSFYVLVQMLLTGDLSSSVTKPFFNARYSHNTVPELAAFSMLFLSYFRLLGKKVRFDGWLQLYFLIFIVLSGARKSLLIAIVAILLYPLLFKARDEKIEKKLTYVTIFSLSLVGIYFLIMKVPVFYNSIGVRFEGFFAGFGEGELEESSALSRSQMLQTAILLIKQSPLLGHGIGAFQTFDGSYGTWCHNNFLELWVSGGIGVVLIYYSFYIYALIRLFKIKNKDALGWLSVSILLCQVIYDLLSTTYAYRMPVFWLLIIDFYIRTQNKRVTSITT